MYYQASTRQYLIRNNLDLNKLYYHFSASSGDLWFIASVLSELLSRYPHSMILTINKYLDLLRIFVGQSKLKCRIIVIPDEHDIIIRQLTSIDTHAICPVTPEFMTHEKGVIRPCHIVMYPYFAGLYMSGSISYFKLLRHALGVYNIKSPSSPLFYSADDYEYVNHLLEVYKSTTCVLVNPVNFSHKSLPLNSWTRLLKCIENHNMRIVFNISRSDEVESEYLGKILSISKNPGVIQIPLHLMALVMNNFKVIVGVDGGGMAVAAGFTTSDCLIIGTKSVFFSEYAKYRSSSCANPYADDFAAACRPDLSGVSFYYSDSVDDLHLDTLSYMLKRMQPA